MFAFALLFTFLMLNNDTAKAIEIEKTSNQASTYSANGVSWYMVAGQKTYTSSFYVSAGNSIIISVAPSVSGAKYSVGILQPSGTERKITKTGTTSTTYAITSSGNYKVFIHNVTSSAVDYRMSYGH